jgi:hypothetical protein
VPLQQPVAVPIFKQKKIYRNQSRVQVEYYLAEEYGVDQDHVGKYV